MNWQKMEALIELAQSYTAQAEQHHSLGAEIFEITFPPAIFNEPKQQ